MVAQPGEAGGFYVRSQPSGQIGYLKPLNHNPGHPRAALEKIASDLAFEVGVNVPPVVLYVRPDAQAPQPREVAISLVPDKVFEWQYLFQFGAPDGGITLPALAHLARQVLGVSSGVVALDAWLGNTDRNNPRNAILDCTPGTNPGTMFFLDFANTMIHGGQWDEDRYKHFVRVGVPAFFAGAIDQGRVRATAEAIKGLTDAMLEEIVMRLPPAFLAQDARGHLLGCLRWRKEQVLPAWAQWYPGT